MSSKLNKIIKIAIPSKVGNDIIDTATRQAVLDSVTLDMATMFGGATLENVSGAWVMQDKTIVSEAITMVYSYCSARDVAKYKSRVIEIARSVAKALLQEATAVIINNELLLIK